MTSLRLIKKIDDSGNVILHALSPMVSYPHRLGISAWLTESVGKENYTMCGSSQKYRNDKLQIVEWSLTFHNESDRTAFLIKFGDK